MSSRTGSTASALLCCLLTSSVSFAAPGLLIETLPWDALDGPSAFEAGFARYEDGRSGWRVDDLGLQHVGTRGEDGRWFLGWHHLSFSSAELPVLERWPGPAGPDAVEGWPGESRVAGWGRPEIGLLDRVDLPLIGRSAIGLGAALPFASNTLYPFAARSTSLRLHLRRSIALGDAWRLHLDAGRVLSIGAAGEELHEDAFSPQTRLGGALEWRRDGRSVHLGWTGQGDDSRRIEGRLGWPLDDRVTLAFTAVHEEADAADRLFGTRYGVSIRILGLGAVAGDSADAPPDRPTARSTTEEM